MNLKKRIKRLEGAIKPRKLISWADYVIWATYGKEDERIELGEGLRELAERILPTTYREK